MLNPIFIIGERRGKTMIDLELLGMWAPLNGIE